MTPTRNFRELALA